MYRPGRAGASQRPACGHSHTRARAMRTIIDRVRDGLGRGHATACHYIGHPCPCTGVVSSPAALCHRPPGLDSTRRLLLLVRFSCRPRCVGGCVRARHDVVVRRETARASSSAARQHAHLEKRHEGHSQRQHHRALGRPPSHLDHHRPRRLRQDHRGQVPGRQSQASLRRGRRGMSVDGGRRRMR